MAALWEGYLGGRARDVVTNHTVTCCTKWSYKDRHTTSYEEWRFEYDHIFATRDHIRVTEPAALIPYQYPGAAAPCADAACTGEDPPKNTTASFQGSWHRGWKVQLEVDAAEVVAP